MAAITLLSFLAGLGIAVVTTPVGVPEKALRLVLGGLAVLTATIYAFQALV